MFADDGECDRERGVCRRLPPQSLLYSVFMSQYERLEVEAVRSGDPGAPRIVWIHGSPGSAEAWADFLVDPVPGAESFAPDRPGFGATGGDALRTLAEARSATMNQAMHRFYASAGAPETIDGDILLAATVDGDGPIQIVDVRPAGEYRNGHLQGAISLPLDQLPDRLAGLPAEPLYVATCRGPFCVFAADAVRQLRARGLTAVRYEGGIAEWRALGGLVVAGEAP